MALLVQRLVPGQPPIPVEALLDSGASDCFLDPSVLAQHHLHPLPLRQPIPLELIDGSTPSTGPITHYFPSRIRIHGVHTEDLTCHVMPLGHFKLILGFPWLVRHNPRIDWSSGVLTFASAFCSSSCLSPPPSPSPPSSLPSAPSLDPPPPLSVPPPSLSGTSFPTPSTPHFPHPDLFQQVPAEYNDYLDVFSEAQANTLPPHRKYDLQIPLLPDAKPP